ncbi:MAG: amidohydrolase family protein [Burkholderiales bacterium]
MNSGEKGVALIDVHHHLCPPAYAEAVQRIQPVFKLLLDWSPAKSMEDMDRAGVATSVLSITTPGLWFGEAGEARRLARLCNDYSAQLVRDYAGRFGFFAALPLPDIEGSLREIEYALDDLKADGVCLFTSYDAHYLGEAMFDPIFEELNRRGAIVYTHPVICPCSVNIVPVVSEACIEYGTDTTRTIASLLFSGAAARYSNIRFIFSHAGGTMPFLIGRFLQQQRGHPVPDKLPHGVMHEVGKFFYDTAQACNPAAMAALRHVTAPSQILFGTDFPWGKASEHAENLQQCGFTEPEVKMIHRDNACALIPRLGG